MAMRGKTSQLQTIAESPNSGFSKLAELQAQKLFLDGAAALAQANMLLTRENHANGVAALAHANMRMARENHANMLRARENMMLHAMQDNARLAHENRILRMQTQAPPGLEAEAHSGSLHGSMKQSSVKGKMSKRSNSPRGSEVSTSAGSTPPGSWTLDISPPGSWTLDTSSPPGSWTLDDCAGGKSQGAEEPPLMPGSSVMMRNLPNDYTRSTLLELLHTEGFGDKYDFVYLPMDFRSCSGLGYAFINFLSLDIAEQFRQHFGGFNRWSVASEKVCEVTWSSLQGLEAHIERFRNSPVMHESISDDQKPALFEGSERAIFPEPTRKIRVPRHWHRRR